MLLRPENLCRTDFTLFLNHSIWFRSATKTFGAVIPILGITWIFGVMAFNDSAIVFQYIFAIVNSLQVGICIDTISIVNRYKDQMFDKFLMMSCSK